MARLRTIACELGLGTSGEGNCVFDGFKSGTVVTDTTFNRSPGTCYKIGSAASQVNYFGMPNAAGTGATIFPRCYFRINTADGLPTGTVKIFWVDNAGSTSDLVAIKLTSAGVLQLWNLVANAQIGSDGPTINLDEWFRLEIGYTGSATGTGYVEALYNGVSFAKTTTATTNANAPRNIRVGYTEAPGTNKFIYVDDIAINDATGASQTSFPGPGNVVYLHPVSDSSRVGWTDGAGGTTALWDALDNTPPVGVAVASATATSQIKDKAANTTDAYEANMTDYTTAGVPGNARIVCVQPVIDCGQDSTTATNFTYAITSNPAGGNNTAIGGSTVAGTWMTGWTKGNAPSERWGAALISPAVTPATQPKMKVTKGTSSSTITQMVDGMAIAVEYNPPSLVAAQRRVTRNSLLRR